MDIISFNNNSSVLTEKYAPTKITDIIGAKRQVYAIVDWLKKYKNNSAINLNKINSKKNGKKTRRRKIKVKTNESENSSTTLAPVRVPTVQP